MQPRIKMGLIVGVIGLVLNVCVSGFIGLCGPFASMLAGGVAGFLTANQEKLTTKADGARAGAVAGGIAGGLMIIGQILGGVIALVLMQTSGTQLPFGTIPTGDDPSMMAIFYLSGLGTGLCFGIFGAALAAGAGAGAGYFGTPDQPAATPSL